VASDLKSAKECWQEHTTIRKVALHVLDDTGGLFVLSPSDAEGYVDDCLGG
jgi:glycerol-3-phosphate dehydrogenase